MKLNFSTSESIQKLVHLAAEICGKDVYVGHGSLTEHEMFATKYILVRGKDGLFHVSDFMSAKDYVEWEGSNYYIHARIYFDPGNFRQVTTQIKFFEYVGDKDGALLATIYYKSSANYYTQDLANYINQLNICLSLEENYDKV